VRALLTIFLAIVSLSMTVRPAAGEAGGWTTFGGSNRRTGVTGGRVSAALFERWSADLGGDLHPQAVADGGAVFVGSDRGVMCSLDRATGATIWRYDAGARIRSTATVTADRVFFGDQAGVIHALDRATGGVIWSYRSPGWVRASPAVDGPRVIAVSSGGQVIALEAATGKLVWEVNLSDVTMSSPAVDSGTVVVETMSGRVVALCAASGDRLWERQIGAGLTVAPVIAGDTVVVASTAYNAGGVFALDLKNGSERWRYSVPGNNLWSGPAVVAGRVYVGNSGGVHAIDLVTGRQVWLYRATSFLWEDRKHYPNMGTPVIAGEVALVPATFAVPAPSSICAISTVDGSLLWETVLTWKPTGSISAHEGAVFAGGYDGRLHVLSGISVVLNGAPVVFPGQEPFIRNGRTLVPFRGLFEALGATVDWDTANRTVTGTAGTVIIKLKIGSTVATVGGREVTLDVPAEIVNGRTVVPLRFVVENLGAKVEWVAASLTVMIIRNQ
jgi:outer membrane protein assembly factor BamB